MKKINLLSDHKTQESFITIAILLIILSSVLHTIRGIYITFSQFESDSFIFISTTLFSTISIFYLIYSMQRKYEFKHHRFHCNVIHYFLYESTFGLGLLIILCIPCLTIYKCYSEGPIWTSSREIIFITINLLCFSILLFSIGYLNRKYFKNIFPFFELSTIQNHALQLIVNYDDFINRKIDNPTLIIGQDFLIKIHEHPRNEDEKNTVLIINQNTTPNPSIVTVIINKELADGLRNNEFILKTELKSISEFTKLEIALWLDRNHQSL
jgi:hypothetical protein